MDDDRKRKALDILKRHGISKITATFNGGGDSGQVDNIDCDGLVARPGDHPYPQDWEENGYNWRGKNTFEDFLFELAEELLSYDTIGHDWINNDGGYGELIIVPGNDYIHVDLNLNEMTSEHVPLDLSLSGATPPPDVPVTPKSNENKSLHAVMTSLANQGLITPAHLDQFRGMMVEASLYKYRMEDEYNKAHGHTPPQQRETVEEHAARMVRHHAFRRVLDQKIEEMVRSGVINVEDLNG
jgi:hypothetical protein